MLALQFGELKVNSNDVLTWGEAQELISFGWKAKKNSYYTIVIYDINQTKPMNFAYVHYLIMNIPGDNLDLGQEILSYEAPNPPGRRGHHYVFTIYEQPRLIKMTGRAERYNINLAGMMIANSLKEVGNITFVVTPKNIPTANIIPSPVEGRYMFPSTPLSEQDQKYCRCLLDVATKQTPECLEKKIPRAKLGGKVCAVPYQVCTSSTGRSGKVECSKYYDFDSLPDDKLQAYAHLNKITVPKPYNRKRMLNNIHSNLQKRGKI